MGSLKIKGYIDPQMIKTIPDVETFVKWGIDFKYSESEKDLEDLYYQYHNRPEPKTKGAAKK